MPARDTQLASRAITIEDFTAPIGGGSRFRRGINRSDPANNHAIYLEPAHHHGVAHQSEAKGGNNHPASKGNS